MAEQSRFERAVHLAERARSARALLATLALAAGVGACRSGDVKEGPPPEVVVTTAGSGARPRGINASDRKPPLASPPWHIPVGPKLAIVPGQGLGPIRFGANLDTIERLIGEPCEEKREEAGRVVCRYSAQAVEFVLADNGVVEFRAHRLGRLLEPNSKVDFGIFNGGFESGVAFGMLPAAVQELLGKPKATRPVEGENLHHTVEVFEYDGFRLEFDRISPESVVLGGVILTGPAKAP